MLSSQSFFAINNNNNINLKMINDLLLNYIGSTGSIGPGYPSKRLYVKRTSHEMHDKNAIITGVTLGLKSN